MLIVTDRAIEAVRDIVAAEPDTERERAGLRIFARSPRNPGPIELGVAVAEAPGETDQVIVEGEAHIFLDSEVTEFLDDKVLDADASGDVVHFTVAEK